MKICKLSQCKFSKKSWSTHQKRQNKALFSITNTNWECPIAKKSIASLLQSKDTNHFRPRPSFSNEEIRNIHAISCLTAAFIGYNHKNPRALPWNQNAGPANLPRQRLSFRRRSASSQIHPNPCYSRTSIIRTFSLVPIWSWIFNQDP